MRTLFIFVLLVAAVAAFRGYTDGHNGQSACKHRLEYPGTVWRNNFDPTRYWECVSAGVPSVLRICKSQFMFQPALNRCVHNSVWQWTPFEDPWSLA